MAEKIRLQKFMSCCGVASRRKSEEMIAAGLVRVNGKGAFIGEKIDPESDNISVNGKRLIREKNYVYLMLYKPRGYITTLSDEKDRKCVARLIADVGKRIYPIGRLDRKSEGLLLFTNDGEFANAMLHPSRHIAKTYRVSVKPGITEKQLAALASPIEIDGKKTLPANVKIIKNENDKAVLEIILYEGRNRQIRRLCEEAGLETVRLKRLAIERLGLGGLKAGEYRYLTRDEVKMLKRQSGCS